MSRNFFQRYNPMVYYILALLAGVATYASPTPKGKEWMDSIVLGLIALDVIGIVIHLRYRLARMFS